MTPKDIEKLESVMTAAVSIKKDYERLQTTDLVKENRELRDEIENFADDYHELYKEKKMLKSENQELKIQNRDLKAQVKDLKQEIVKIYDSTKEFVKQHAISPSKFKEAFKNLVDKVKEKTSGLHSEQGVSQFEIVDKNAKKKERAKDNELSR